MSNKLFEDKVFFREREVERITKLSIKAIKHWQKKIPIFKKLRQELDVRNGYFSKTEVELLIEAKRLLLEEEKEFDEVNSILEEIIYKGDSNKKPVQDNKNSVLKINLLSEIKNELTEILKILKQKR